MKFEMQESGYGNEAASAAMTWVKGGRRGM